MVLETWWYKLADTNAKSILEADVLLSQENCVAFGCWVLQGSTRAWSSIQLVRNLCVLGLWYLIFGFFLSSARFWTMLKSPMYMVFCMGSGGGY